MSEPFFAMIVPLSGGPRPGHDLPGQPVYPSHGLPGAQPGIDNTLPSPPPGYPSHGLPGAGGPVDPGYGRPGWSPVDPGYGHPGIGSGRPENPIVIPDPPPDGTTKPTPPPEIYPPLPPNLSAPAVILVWVIGVGYRWIHSGGARPDQGLPPTAQPKR